MRHLQSLISEESSHSADYSAADFSIRCWPRVVHSCRCDEARDEQAGAFRFQYPSPWPKNRVSPLFAANNTLSFCRSTSDKWLEYKKEQEFWPLGPPVRAYERNFAAEIRERQKRSNQLEIALAREHPSNSNSRGIDAVSSERYTIVLLIYILHR